MHSSAAEINGPGKGKKYSPCTFLWQALIIFWDGAVLPCTQSVFIILEIIFHDIYLDIIHKIRESNYAARTSLDGGALKLFLFYQIKNF